MAIKFLSAVDHGAYQLPTVDGSNGQVLTTDGNGNVTFQSVAASPNYYLSGASFNTGTGVLTLTVSGATNQTVDLDGRYALSSHVHNYDNYGSWNLKTNSVQRTTVQSGGDLNLVAGSNVSLSYSAGGTVTITSTDTNTDTNYYVDGLSFDTGNGILTASVNGASNPTVDLDGRYVEIAGDTMTGDLNLGNNSLNAVENIYLDNAIFSQGDTNTYTQFHSGDQWRVVTGGGERLEVTNTHTYLQNILYLNSNLNTTSTSEVHYGNISTSANGTVVRGGFMNPASEGNMVHLPHLVNDLSGFNHWGTISVSGLYKSRSGSSGNYTYGSPVTVSDFDNGAAFDSYSSTAGSWYSDNGPDGQDEGVGVITLEWTNELTYSAWVGIVFGSGSFTAQRVKIEAYRGGAWQTLCDLTNNTSNVVLRQIGSNSGSGSATTKLRYTLGGSGVNSYFRIHTLYAANYRAGDNNISNLGTALTRGVHFFEKYKDNYGWGSYFPATNASYDLGSSSRRWKSIYADGGDSTQWNTAYGWGDHAAAGYLTSYTDTNDIDYINNASFNTSNGILTLSGVGNAGATVDLDGRYLTGLPSSTGTLTTFTNAVTIESNSDGILTLKQTGLGGTAGVKDGGWNYIQFYDSEDDRQGYFGIDSSGHFLFNPEVANAEVRMNRLLRVSAAIVGTSSLTLTGAITASGYNDSNWNTAYGWGDHSTQGYLTSESDTLASVTARGNTTNGDINVNGDIILTGTATTTNQARTIDFTGFDKEGTTDFSDRAYIQHTTNTGGHSGSVLVISSQNDSGDGIAFQTNASSKLKHNSNNIATEPWVTSQGYLTSYTDTNDIDYINAASFNTNTGVITGTGVGNAGFTVDIDGRYLLDTTDTFTGALTINGYIKGNGQELILSAGESHSVATGQTNEFVYINAESGLQINSSPDNWASGWAGRKTTTINDTSGNSTFAGALFWSGGGSAESNAAYDNMITAAAVAGGANKTLTLTQQDGGTITATWTDTDTNDVDYINSASFANGVLTLSGVGNAGASVNLDGRYQLAGTYNTVIGTDSDINTSGATIIDNIYVTDGVITSMGTRTLTPTDIGAAHYNDFRSLGTQAFTAGGGSNNTITTTQLISEMEGDGAFDSYTSAFKTSWSYAGNDDLSDAGNFTETAGTSWLTWTDNSSDSTRGNITALAIAPNTGGSAGRVFIYNDQGSTYSPGWREVWTNMSLDPIINATVSNDTITFTKANGGTFNISTSDANTNYYLDGLSFNTGNGILTASVNGTTNQTVNLDGRYQLAGTYNTIIGTDSDINTSGATVIGQLNMTDGVITSHTTRTLDASSLGITQPDPPSLNALNIVGETIEVVFDQSPTPDIDKYEVWSSVSGGSYGLIANIPTEDIAPVMTAIDAAFSVSGTQAYRVYAIKNGIYSVAATGSTTFSTPSLSVVNMSVINLNPAYYIQYDLPDSRFIDHIEIYMDVETTSSSLSRTGASLIYSGSNSSYMYQIGASDLDKFHQFWVEVVAS